jgi:apolipoprotein N-acyltransferase
MMMIIMIVIMCLREWILSGFPWLVLDIDWIMREKAG